MPDEQIQDAEPAADATGARGRQVLTETRTFTRRTLDWLSASLLKGMSREDDVVIF
jgi:hypothetical protein